MPGPRHPPLEVAAEPQPPVTSADRALLTRASSWEEQAHAEAIRAQTRAGSVERARGRRLRENLANVGHRASVQGAAGGGGEASSASGTMPSSFVCSITCDIMSDPVISADGHTYERAAIEKWFASQKAQGRPLTSPKTNAELPSGALIPNFALRQAIGEWCVGESGVVGSCMQENK